MLRGIKYIFFYFLSSFDGFSKGASASKISAFIAVLVSMWVTKRFTTTQNIMYVIIIWLMFALLCLGIVLFKQVNELVNSYKHGNEGKTQIDEKPALADVISKEINKNKRKKK